jgi:sec-independent protein translocase protein TatA
MYSSMFGLGVGELILILVIVLLIFGAGKLPHVGDALGKAIRNFKSSAKTAPDAEIEVSPSGKTKAKEISSRSSDSSDDDVVEVLPSKQKAEKPAR